MIPLRIALKTPIKTAATIAPYKLFEFDIRVRRP